MQARYASAKRVALSSIPGVCASYEVRATWLGLGRPCSVRSTRIEFGIPSPPHAVFQFIALGSASICFSKDVTYCLD